MGICGGKISDQEARNRSKQLDDTIRKQRQDEQKDIKLLLLGAGESGKSTIFKQMKLIYTSEGFTEEERRKFTPVVYSNAISCMKSLVAAVPTLNLGSYSSADAEAAAKRIEDLPVDCNILDDQTVADIKLLWADSTIQRAYGMRSRFQLADSAEYFFRNIDTMHNPDYIPSEQDILRTRVRTTGIVEAQFHMQNATFKMFDVGGQRNERKKWIHCFENVTAVIFVAALSEYDQVLYEDEATNRMDEALKLFDEICNSRWFEHTAMILFLNKTDLFAEKIKTSPLSNYYPDYAGGDDFKAACEYIEDLFLQKNATHNKVVYPHCICATDTDNVKKIFNACKDTILRGNLAAAGFMH